jgi:hypothetical protein
MTTEEDWASEGGSVAVEEVERYANTGPVEVSVVHVVNGPVLRTYHDAKAAKKYADAHALVNEVTTTVTRTKLY